MTSAPALLKDLAGRWSVTAGGADQGVLRACSMTLIVLAGPGGEQELGETLAGLMAEHPARCVALRLAGEEKAPLEARTLIQCWRPFGRREQICCEQIEILLGLAAIPEARRLLLGLLVPDLPVMIWIPEPRWLGSACESLLPLAGKTIVDSGRLPACAALEAMAALPEGARADLAWTRLTRWRELIRTLAGDRPFQRAGIRYAGASLPATALYLAGWLRGAGGRALPIEFSSESPAPPPAGHGLLRGLTLSTSDGDIGLHRPAGVHLEASFQNRVSRYLFPVFTAQALLREELSLLTVDRAYEVALAEAKSILKAEGVS